MPAKIPDMGSIYLHGTCGGLIEDDFCTGCRRDVRPGETIGYVRATEAERLREWLRYISGLTDDGSILRAVDRAESGEHLEWPKDPA